MNCKLLRTLVLVFILLTGVVISQAPVQAQLAPGSGAEAPLTEQYTELLTGNYCFATGGNSLIEVDSSDFTLNVPGTPVAAYWVWSSRVIEENGVQFPDPVDNTLTVTGTRGDGAAINTEITATVQEESTYSSYIRNYAFVAPDNVFQFVSQGLNEYTISGIEVPPTVFPESHGAALTVVYESAACPYAQIDLAYGLDTFFHGWPEPYGPNSAVACVSFEPVDAARILAYTVIVAGAAQPEVANSSRPSGMWTASVNAPDDILPPNLVGEAFAAGIQDPFNSTPGLEWDIYSGQITIDAGDNYGCFQVESPAGDEDPGGISGAWLNLTTGIPLATGSIGDFVWADYDGDGVQDGNEPGLEGVTVTLTVGATVRTVVTDEDGFYIFEGLPPGTYTVTVDTATGDLATGVFVQTGDPDGTFDSQSEVTLEAGENNLEQDFGYQPLGSVGDTVWLDADGNGVINGGEAGIPGVTVTLVDGQGDEQTDVTNANGIYGFSELPTGVYTVNIDPATLPADLIPTFDADGIATPNTTTLTLNPGQDRVDIDFGYNSEPIILGSIGDTVWLDENRNGVQDNGEAGIPNVALVLIGAGAPQNTMTNSSGFYSFTDLEAGSYTVIVDPTTLPAAVGPTFDLDGIGTPNQTAVPLAEGQNRTDADFGYADTLGSIGDTVWRDDNGNGVQESGEPGIPNITLTLTDNTGASRTTVTDTNGEYTFGGLVAGVYQVAVDAATLPPRYRQTYDLDGLGTPNLATAALGQAEDRTDVDFGYQPLGSLGDTVWLDGNDNGVQESGEPGIPNVTVVLIYANGTRAFDQTDGNGQYGFSELPPGVYSVQIDVSTLPAGFVPTYDLDGLSSPNVAQLTLAPAQIRTDVDFGYREPPLSIDDETPDGPGQVNATIFLPVVARQ